MARLDEVLDEQSDDDVDIRGVADERDPDEEGEMEGGDDEEKGKEKEGSAATKDDKPAEPTKKRRPRFTEDHLCGERGLQKAYETFPKMCKYRGEGHEAEFLNRLLRCYMEWSHSLFPYMQFEEMVDRLQSMGGKAKVRRKLEELRGIQREAYLKQRYGQDYEKDLEEYRKAKLREEAKEEEEATRRREELYGASRRRNLETRRPDGEPEIQDLGAEVEESRGRKKESKAQELFASDEEGSEGPQRTGGDKEESADKDREEEPVKAKRGRGKGKGKGRAQKQRKEAKPKGRGRRRKKNVLSDSDADDDDEEQALEEESSEAGESDLDEHKKPKRKKLRTAGSTKRSKAKSKRDRSVEEEDPDQADNESDSGKVSSLKPGSSADDDDDGDNDAVMTSRLKSFLRDLKAQGQHKVLSAKAIANRAMHECDLHDRDPKSVKAAIVGIYTELTHGEESPEKEAQGARPVDRAFSKAVDGKIGSRDEQARGPMRKKPRTRRVKRHAESDDDDLDVEWNDSQGKPTAMEVQETGATKLDSEEDNREEEAADVTLMMDDGEETVPQKLQVGESSSDDEENIGATESVAEDAAGLEEEPRQAYVEPDETIHMDHEPDTVAQEAVDLDELGVRIAADAPSMLDKLAADESSRAAEEESGVPTGMRTEDAKEGSVAPVDDEDRMVSQDF